MYEYTADVTDVLDGDTIIVNIDLGFRLSYKTPVRLFGINAPEVHSKSEDEKKHGLIAKNQLATMLWGKRVKIQSVKPQDKFGRFLANVWLTEGIQEKSVNEQLIDLKVVKPWDGHGRRPV